jgi:hypothetical protein
MASKRRLIKLAIQKCTLFLVTKLTYYVTMAYIGVCYLEILTFAVRKILWYDSGPVYSRDVRVPTSIA